MESTTLNRLDPRTRLVTRNGNQDCPASQVRQADRQPAQFGRDGPQGRYDGKR
jgi:hypothetical protein